MRLFETHRRSRGWRGALRKRPASWFVLVPLLLIAATSAAAQTVTGRVTSGDTRQPLEGATVTVEGTSVSTRTRTDGRYTIRAAGTGVLAFTAPGYLPQSLAVNGRSVLDVQLQVAPATANQSAEPLRRYTVVASPGWLGLMLRSSSSAVGTMDVTSVAASSPAAEAGIRTGDRIVLWNGGGNVAAQMESRSLEPGDTVRLRISRAGERDRDVTIVAAPRSLANGLTREIQLRETQVRAMMDSLRATMEQRAQTSRFREDSLRLTYDRLMREVRPRADSLRVVLERAGRDLAQRGVQEREMTRELRARAGEAIERSLERLDTLRLRVYGFSTPARADSIRGLFRQFEIVRPGQLEGGDIQPRVQMYRGAGGDSLRTMYGGAVMDSVVRYFRGPFRSGVTDSLAFRILARPGFPADSIIARISPRGFFESPIGLGYTLTAGRSGVAGAEFIDLTEGLRVYFGAERGALVIRVAPQTPAATAGLREGDVVVRAGSTAIAGIDSLRRAVAAAPTGPLELEVIREGARQTVRLER